MKLAPLPLSLRHAARLALAGAAFLCAGSVSAAGNGYSFQIVNLTASGGDPTFPVTDDVTFTNLQIHEIYADNFAPVLSVGSLDTGAVALQTNFFFFNGTPNGVLSDPLHGALTSAVLTGSLDISGLISTDPMSLTLQPTLDPASQYQQLVSRDFSASLFGASPSGIGIGQFSLLDSSSNPAFPTVQINANPVPEASTTVSLGLMLLLAVGGLVIVRRRRSAKAE